jgi:hypothetical protein
MSKSALSAVVIGLGVTMTASLLSVGQEPPVLNTLPKENATILMQAKLASTQKIIEGLMAGDYSRIRAGAGNLANVCEAKNWRRLENEVVVHYRAELMRSSLKLAALAESQNLDGASYAFMNTLTTCINCHQYSRDVLRIATNPTSQVVPIPSHDPATLRNRRSSTIYP